MFLLTLLFLSACSSANKFSHIDVGMSKIEVVNELGVPKRQRTGKNKQTEKYIYMLRETPSYIALGGCVLLPMAIPTLGVMWFSDGCLGERADYEIDFLDGKVKNKKKIAKESH